MNVNKVNALRISIYDRAGMLQVNRATRDFAPTSNGMANSYGLTRSARNTNDHEFEMNLEEAMKAIEEKSIDYQS